MQAVLSFGTDYTVCWDLRAVEFPRVPGPVWRTLRWANANAERIDAQESHLCTCLRVAPASNRQHASPHGTHYARAFACLAAQRSRDCTLNKSNLPGSGQLCFNDHETAHANVGVHDTR